MLKRKLPSAKNNDYYTIGVASLPRDDDGRIDERELIRLCGKAKMPIESLYELYPYEFVFYIEGYLEDQREYFENISYSLFTSIRQALNSKTTRFKNPFEKQEVHQKQQRELTEDEYESEVNALMEIFNL